MDGRCVEKNQSSHFNPICRGNSSLAIYVRVPAAQHRRGARSFRIRHHERYGNEILSVSQLCTRSVVAKHLNGVGGWDIGVIWGES